MENNNNTWAKTDLEKAINFKPVFEPYLSLLQASEEKYIFNELNVPLQIILPIKKVRVNEIKEIIKVEMNSKKAAGYDSIIGKILKELSQKVNCKY